MASDDAPPRTLTPLGVYFAITLMLGADKFVGPLWSGPFWASISLSALAFLILAFDFSPRGNPHGK